MLLVLQTSLIFDDWLLPGCGEDYQFDVAHCDTKDSDLIDNIDGQVQRITN